MKESYRPIVAEQPIGIVITEPPYGEKDPSTGQYISVIKTGANPNCMMSSLQPTPKVIESEVMEPGNEKSEE